MATLPPSADTRRQTTGGAASGAGGCGAFVPFLPGLEVGAGGGLGTGLGAPPGRRSWGEVESLLPLARLARIVILFIFTFEPCKACGWGRSVPATRCQRHSAGPPAWPEAGVGAGRAPPARQPRRPRSRPPRVAGARAGHPRPAARREASPRGPGRPRSCCVPRKALGHGARGRSRRGARGHGPPRRVRTPGSRRPGPRFPSLRLPPPPALRPSPPRPSLPALPLLLPGHVSPFFVCSGNNFSPLGAPRPDAPRRRRAGGGTGRGERRGRREDARRARRTPQVPCRAATPAPLPPAPAAAPRRPPPRARRAAPARP